MNSSFKDQYKETFKFVALSAANIDVGMLNLMSGVDNPKIFNIMMTCLSFATATATSYIAYKKFQKEKMLSNIQR